MPAGIGPRGIGNIVRRCRSKNLSGQQSHGAGTQSDMARYWRGGRPIGGGRGADHRITRAVTSWAGSVIYRRFFVAFAIPGMAHFVITCAYLTGTDLTGSDHHRL